MKGRAPFLFCGFVLLSALLVHAPPVRAQGNNSVTGMVFGVAGRPVPDAHVELLSDTYSTLRRTKTNASGLYYFRGLASGNYKVRVMSYGIGYEEQTQAVALVPMSAIRGSGAVSEQLNFQLTPKRDPNAGPLSAPEVIFAQDVPAAAQALYEEGVKRLKQDKHEEAFESFKKALEAFPDYFAALDRLGTEYVVRGYYRPAYVLLVKAMKVNPRSHSSTLGFGITQFRLGEAAQSIKTFESAIQLYDQSPIAHMWLGIASLETNALVEAERSLKKAGKLSSGKSADVHWQLARLYNKQNRYLEAAEELESYLKLNPEASNRKNIEETVAKLRTKS